MEAIQPEARKSLFTKQDSLGGFSADVEGVGGGLPDVRNVGENIGGEEGVWDQGGTGPKVSRLHTGGIFKY